MALFLVRLLIVTEDFFVVGSGAGFSLTTRPLHHDNMEDHGDQLLI